MEATPLAARERISLLDSLRGFALLGILLMNIPYFGMPAEAAENPMVYGETSGANYYTWWIVSTLFEGTMRGIFSMLFGTGAYLLITRLEDRQPGLVPADIYFRRIIYLLLFGLINAYVILWPGDILVTYAVAGLFFFVFRNLNSRALLGFGLVFLVVCSIQGTIKINHAASTRQAGIAAQQLVDKHIRLGAHQNEDLAKWHSYLSEHNPGSLRVKADSVAQDMRSKGYLETVAEMAKVNVYLKTQEQLPSWIWESLGYFLVGLALFKWDVQSGKRSQRFYAILAVCGYAIGLPLRILFIRHAFSVGYDASRYAEFFPANIYQIGRMGMTLGHIGLFVLIYKTGWLRFVFGALANVGRMAFTNYLAQSVICTFFFFGYGFGRFGLLQRYELYEFVAVVWAFQIAFSALWMQYFQYGPLEWVWRSLTYWKRWPMRR